MDGIIVVNKEKGWTSHDVVAKLRTVLGQKKIGHTGTLDPDATGVLPVLLGKATKLSEVIAADDKVYEAVLRLGVKTTTLDMSGEVMAERKVALENDENDTDAIRITEKQIREVINSFIGEIDQVPPMYSAIKVDGKKLYELAREGKEIERKSRRVKISEIEIIDINVPLITIKVSCSKGTYIRTLCDDIGEKLGTYAAMQELTRLRSGQFKIENSFSLKEIEDGQYKIITLKEVLGDMPKFIVDSEHEKALLNGNILELAWGSGQTDKDGTLAFSSSGEFIGIYKIINGKLKPYKMLL